MAYGESDARLATATTRLVPADIEKVEVLVDGAADEDVAVAGLVDAMLVTEAIAQAVDYDPGAPQVPKFGREIHHLDPAAFRNHLEPMVGHIAIAARRKLQLSRKCGSSTAVVEDAAKAYIAKLEAANIQAIVCDFDGTLCRAENRYDGMDHRIVRRLTELMDQGLRVGIASGTSTHSAALPMVSACNWKATSSPAIGRLLR